jgi:single-stranded DNA-binding protein
MIPPIFIQGRLGFKAELKETRTGKPWAKILLQEEGARESQRHVANILPIVLFGRAAERVESLLPGEQVTVRCRLEGTKFTTDSGETRFGCQLVGEQIFIAAAKEEAI